MRLSDRGSKLRYSSASMSGCVSFRRSKSIVSTVCLVEYVNQTVGQRTDQSNRIISMNGAVFILSNAYC